MKELELHPVRLWGWQEAKLYGQLNQARHEGPCAAIVKKQE